MRNNSDFSRYCRPIIDKNGDNIFVVDTSGYSLTYNEAAVKVRQLAEQLNGLAFCGPVAWMGDNTWGFYIVVLACLYCNYPVFIFNSDWSKEQVYQNIKKFKIVTLLYPENVNIDAKLSCVEIPEVHLAQILTDPNRGIHCKILKQGKGSKDLNSYFGGIYLATSGTTNESKWVFHGLESMFLNMKAFADKVSLKSEDRIHSILPLFTSNGMTITFFLPFFAGASIYLDRRFSPYSIGSYFANALKNEATVLSLVPTVVSILSRMISKETVLKMQGHKIRFAICGTAPLPEEERDKFTQITHIPVYTNYGLTETLFVSSQNSEFSTPGSSGTLLDGVETILYDLEIGVKGPSVMQGYVGENTCGNVFLTGDLGVLKNNELFIHGRKKDMVIRGGYNINPSDIDRYLSNFEFIKESYTLGAPSDIAGEELYTFVVINPGQEADAGMLRECITADLPGYMIPKVLVVGHIPRNASGKPLKQELIKKYNL